MEDGVQGDVLRHFVQAHVPSEGSSGLVLLEVAGCHESDDVYGELFWLRDFADEVAHIMGGREAASASDGSWAEVADGIVVLSRGSIGVPVFDFVWSWSWCGPLCMGHVQGFPDVVFCALFEGQSGDCFGDEPEEDEVGAGVFEGCAVWADGSFGVEFLDEIGPAVCHV